MSAIDKATPRPWKWEEGTSYITRHWHDADHPVADIGMLLPWHENSLCASREAGANAALIVRAVNRDHLFDEMVDALEEIAREAPEAEPVDPGATGNYGDSRDYGGDLTHWHLGNIARAVLAKIKAVQP